MKFIDGKQENGVDIDYRAVKKIMDGLGIPDGFYKIPWGAIANGNKYFIPLSQRSTGKTTTLLLFILALSKWSDWRIQGAYIRATEGELAQSHAESLVEVINTYNNGQYIKRLTRSEEYPEGRYNCLVWHWRKFYLARRDDEGKIEERAEREVIQCLSVDRANDYKSSLNMPYCEIIVFDEFIGQRYRVDEAIRFLDLTKTIIRDRLSPIIFMSANTISVTSQYFEELEISRDVKRLHSGDAREIETERGTKIFIELLDLEKLRKSDKKRGLVNRLFYGFANPKLASITGGELFAFESVPHILPKQDDERTIEKRLYIETVGELLNVEYKYNGVQRYHLEIHRATKTYDDSVILSTKIENDPRYVFGLGTPTIEKSIEDAIYNRTLYFSSNEVGAIFYDYIERVYEERRKH